MNMIHVMSCQIVFFSNGDCMKVQLSTTFHDLTPLHSIIKLCLFITALMRVRLLAAESTYCANKFTDEGF